MNKNVPKGEKGDSNKDHVYFCAYILLCQGPSLKHSNEGCLHLFAAKISSNCDLADIFCPAKHFGNRLLMSIFEFPVPFFFLKKNGT
jgi:hypothetical protein